jgi:hypothetical protein
VLQAGLVGLPVVLVGLSLLTGSASSAASLLFFSVVCTFGIGGVFWCGLCFVTGYAVLTLVRAFRPHPADPPLAARPRQALIAPYVRTRLQKGGDPGLIRGDLRRAGWRSDEIEAGFAEASAAGGRE